MAPRQDNRQYTTTNHVLCSVGLLVSTFVLCHATPPGAVDEFMPGELGAGTDAVEAQVQKVLGQGQFSNWKALQEGFEIVGKTVASFQAHSGFADSLELLADNARLLETLESGHLEKAMKALKKYARKSAKNGNIKKMGKFAKMNHLSKLKNLAQTHAKEAIDEVSAQRDILQQQVDSSRKLAGWQAVVQLVESSTRCYSAVSSYHKHSKKLGEWGEKISEWTKVLNENREHMRLVMQHYLQTKEWDFAQISVMHSTANEVLGEVKNFNIQLLEAKKAAVSNRFDGGVGIVSNSINAALNIVNAIASPAPLVSALVGASHVASAVADSATVIFAQADLNQLADSLQRGEILLRESINQVESLKKAQKSHRKEMMRKLKSEVDEPLARHVVDEL